MDEFVYLGSLVTKTGGCTKETERRINLGNFKFHELQSAVWKQPGISISTKVQIYKATVISTVLYGAEAWTCTDEDYVRLNTFNTKRLRAIVGRARDEISNAELYRMTRTQPLENQVRKYRLRWLGHVRRMDDTRLPKKILFGETQGGRKGRGRPKKNWLDCVKDDCEECGIPSDQWCNASKNRTEWQMKISYLTTGRQK